MLCCRPPLQTCPTWRLRFWRATKMGCATRRSTCRASSWVRGSSRGSPPLGSSRGGRVCGAYFESTLQLKPANTRWKGRRGSTCVHSSNDMDAFARTRECLARLPARKLVSCACKWPAGHGNPRSGLLRPVPAASAGAATCLPRWGLCWRPSASTGPPLPALPCP